MKLSQVLAVEKDAKKAREARWTALYQMLQKPDLFTGFTKNYAPVNEEGMSYDPQHKITQQSVPDIIEQTREVLRAHWDSTAQKDAANCNAKADVVVGGKILIPKVPVTTLLFMEKQLVDLGTQISKIPTLPTDTTWSWDPQIGQYVSPPTTAVKTQKIVGHQVVVPATQQHPAQVVATSKDVIEGTWTTKVFSTAIPVALKTRWMKKVEDLRTACKIAREEANMTEAPATHIADAILTQVFDTE